MKDRKIVFTGEQMAELLEEERSCEPLQPDEVEGCTLFTLISPGTELNQYLGNYVKENKNRWKFPIEPGYGGVFRVEGVGGNVSDIKPGQLVFCTAQHKSWQRRRRNEVIPVPAGLLPEKALFARLMNVTMSSLTKTYVRPSARVLITGLGPIGIMGAQVFQRCGYDVVACDPINERCQFARQAGIMEVFSKVPVDNAQYAEKISLVLECSGFEQAVLDGCNILKAGGELILVGVPMVRRSDIYAQEILNRIFRKSITLHGGSEWQVPMNEGRFDQSSCIWQMKTALDWLAKGTIKTDGLYEMVSPEHPQAVYQDVLGKRTGKLCSVFRWQ